MHAGNIKEKKGKKKEEKVRQNCANLFASAVKFSSKDKAVPSMESSRSFSGMKQGSWRKRGRYLNAIGTNVKIDLTQKIHVSRTIDQGCGNIGQVKRYQQVSSINI